MKISIITATYNSAATVRDTIESILGQTHQDVEYIIKDGGSKDETLTICREYEPRFNGRMKIISSPDKGIYDAMNQGIKAATGDVVGLLNSDDFFHRMNVLEAINKVFEENEDVDGIYGDSTVVAADDVNKTVRCTWSKFFRPWMFRIGLMPPHPSFYVRRSCYEKYGLFNDEYKIAADLDLMTRFMLVHKIKTVYLPFPILTMRDGGVSTSLKNKRQLNKEVVDSWRRNGLNQPAWFIYFKYPFRLTELILNRNRK